MTLRKFCALLYAHSSFAIILMGKRELVALLSLSSWCLVVVVWLFLAVSWVCLQFVFVVFPDHTHLLFLNELKDTYLRISNLPCILFFNYLQKIKFLHYKGYQFKKK